VALYWQYKLSVLWTALQCLTECVHPLSTASSSCRAVMADKQSGKVRGSGCRLQAASVANSVRCTTGPNCSRSLVRMFFLSFTKLAAFSVRGPVIHRTCCIPYVMVLAGSVMCCLFISCIYIYIVFVSVCSKITASFVSVRYSVSLYSM